MWVGDRKQGIYKYWPNNAACKLCVDQVFIGFCLLTYTPNNNDNNNNNNNTVLLSSVHLIRCYLNVTI